MNKDTYIDFKQFIILFALILSTLMTISIFITYIFTVNIVKNFISILTPIINQENLIFLFFLILFSLIHYICGTWRLILSFSWKWKKEERESHIKFIISVIFLLSSIVVPFIISFFYLKNVYPIFEQFFITGNPNLIVYLIIFFITSIILSINLFIFSIEDIVGKITTILLINLGTIILCCPLIIHYFISKSVLILSPLCIDCSTGVINWFSIISLFFIYLILFIPLISLFWGIFFILGSGSSFFRDNFVKKTYFSDEDVEKELVEVISKTVKKSKYNPKILKDSNLFKSEVRKISKQSKLENFLDKKINSGESYGRYINYIDDNILNLYFDSDENINYRLDLIRAIFEANTKKIQEFRSDYFIYHIMDAFYQILELDKIKAPTIKYINVRLNDKVFEKIYKLGLIETSNKFALRYINIPKIFKFENKYYKITKIGKKFFKDCKNLQQVIIPESVKRIDNYAFKNCENLKIVSFPVNLTEIGVGAFENCFSLSNRDDYFISFDFLIKLGKYAFRNCKNIKSVSIKRVNDLKKGTFENCHSLKHIPFYFRLPQKIEENAFKNCKSLKIYSHDFEEIEYIGKKAFYGCKSLEEIEFGHISQIGDKSFAYCSSLTNIKISEDIEEIGDYAFKNCKSLNQIVIPSKIKKIGTGAFQNVDNVIYGGNLDINNFNSKNIGKEINVKLNYEILEKLYKQEPFRFKFVDDETNKPFTEIIDNIISIEIPENFTYEGVKYNIIGIWVSFFLFKSLQTIALPSTITELDDNSFSGCESLTNIVIPDSVTKLGNLVFDHCENLTNVTLSKNIIEIGRFCFAYCQNLIEIRIPDSVKNIDRGLCYNCFKLEKIKLPKNITKIPDGTFVHCHSLKSIDIPNTVTEIGEYAFKYSNPSLSFIIPNSVLKIGKQAFDEEYNSLFYNAIHDEKRTITIPDSVIEIGEYAFNEVEKVYYNGKAKGSPWGAKNLIKKK